MDFIPQLGGRAWVEHHCRPWKKTTALFKKTVNLHIGCQRHNTILPGMAREHIKRIDSNGAGGSQDGHATDPAIELLHEGIFIRDGHASLLHEKNHTECKYRSRGGHGVYAVQHTAMTREQLAAVFDAGNTLKFAFREVADD
jgi:hypothetical protein